MWLTDSLPRKLPYARVMTYGFNTKLEGNTSNQHIDVLANYLLNSLEAMRSNTRVWEPGHNTHAPPSEHDNGALRPLIFIAHSLGGLVVKEVLLVFRNPCLTTNSLSQAMMSAINSADHQPLLESIHGALFFGVPSRGMDIKALRPMVRDQPNEYLLHTLGPETDFLRRQSMDFRRMFDRQRPEIIYFYECQKSPTARFVSKLSLSTVRVLLSMVSLLTDISKDGTKYVMDGPSSLLVDKSSATDGYWYEGTPNIYPLDKDHSHLVKFKEHDEVYPAVLNVLMRLVSAALLNGPDGQNAIPAR